MAYRIERLNGEIQKSISITIQSKLKDPRVAGGMVSVTGVNCAKDLKTAKVYVSIFGGSEAEQAEVFAALCSSAGYIRKELASDLKDIRTVPELKFIRDESGAYGGRIDAILEKIKDQ